MFQTTSCGYSKLVSQGAWYNAKRINLIRASSAEKTPKMFLNIDIFSSTEKWAISDHFFDVFSGQDARIELNPFAFYQASRDTSLEYPHGVVWNILKINIFKDCPPWGTLKTHFWEKLKMVQWSLFYTPVEKSLAVKFLKLFGNLTHPSTGGSIP